MLTELLTPAYEQCESNEPGAQFIEGYYYKPTHNGSLEEILRPLYDEDKADIKELEGELKDANKALQDLEDKIAAIDPDADQETLSEAIQDLQLA